MYKKELGGRIGICKREQVRKVRRSKSRRVYSDGGFKEGGFNRKDSWELKNWDDEQSYFFLEDCQ